MKYEASAPAFLLNIVFSLYWLLKGIKWITDMAITDYRATAECSKAKTKCKQNAAINYSHGLMYEVECQQNLYPNGISSVL